MFEYETEIVIRRPVEAVFAYITDLQAIPEWATPVKDIRQETPGNPQLGTKFVEIVGTPFGDAEVHWEIIDLEPGKKCTYAGHSGLATTEVTFICEPADGGTLVQAHGSGQGRGLLRLLTPLLGNRALALRKDALVQLKERLESRGPSEPV